MSDVDTSSFKPSSINVSQFKTRRQDCENSPHFVLFVVFDQFKRIYVCICSIYAMFN